MPPTALDAATVENMVAAAGAAPSIHNTQPWRFRLDPDNRLIEVRAAARRGLRQTDPLGRAVHLSVGAALFNLQVAVDHFGWEPVVRLLPAPSEPELLAAVRLARQPRRSGRRIGDLYHAVWQRHSSRLPYTGHQLPQPLVTELVEAAHAHGATLDMRTTEETSRLLQLTTEAERRNTRDAVRRAESRHWIRDAGWYGIPGSALGPQDMAGRLPMRDFSGAGPGNHRLPSAVFEQRPNLAVLTTTHDRRADWLRAGQALEHVLLIATAHSVRASLHHQALEWPDLRWVLSDTGSHREHVQMLIRLGYGPAGPATPRLPARQALHTGTFRVGG